MNGKILGNRYEILEQLGGGGMALVWKGKDTFLNRLVTVKVLRPEYASDEDFVRRFRREAQAIASLSHPNIVSIYDVGQENDSYYLVMEYVEGENLKDLIRREAPLEPARAIQIGRQIADALEHAHENNIIHRDVKPHNILITRSGRAKLTDFGIAQASASTLTHTDTIVGSVHYISPEQARGEPAGPKSDIYSLAVVLYEMLTGQVPYQGDGAIGVALKHIQEQPLSLTQINPGVPQDLEKVVLRAMNKIADRRHRNAKALGDDLVSISEETKTLAPINDDDEHTRILPLAGINKEDNRIPKNEAKPKGKKLKPAAWVMLAVVVVVLMSGLIFAFNSYLNVAEAKVPPVVGMKLEDAESLLKERGLIVKVSRQNHKTVPKDEVISQEPEANKVVKRGRTVVLLVSNGPDLVDVPDVTGVSYDEARLTLISNEFQPEVPEYIYHPTIDDGKVVEQEPRGKTQAPRGSRVKLKVSRGPEPQILKIPSLIGLTQEEARSRLTGMGLNLAEISAQPSQDYLTGQIIAQNPQAETEVEQGTGVNVTISTGPGPTPRDVLVSITVPQDGKVHEVRIKTIDVRGENFAYVSSHQPGDEISKNIRFYGKGTVQVLIDGNLVDSKSIE
ncbi:Stk1 family PASTA domain-containing Ser/Thr kinase [Desulforamulus aquiferis]|uniref:non-specific serine/threonine protein kinase n=1 Tax=Desulforamulus aquiferis TaxID=1397668 RepID=A0AAW7Z9S9_9FIRM|nr:Stk1 family PASTA domain-containing Ser/Thr kinase [Desulforamulus aquiferis]MDO7786183.1 Stk1 family PASTA domain-containing Ser/Thr kinase [Desulforamulus aquiferis]